MRTEFIGNENEKEKELKAAHQGREERGKAAHQGRGGPQTRRGRGGEGPHLRGREGSRVGRVPGSGVPGACTGSRRGARPWAGLDTGGSRHRDEAGRDKGTQGGMADSRASKSQQGQKAKRLAGARAKSIGFKKPPPKR